MSKTATQSRPADGLSKQQAVARADDGADGSAAGMVDGVDPVGVVDEIEQSLADLDALLAEVGELPAAEETVEDETTAVGEMAVETGPEPIATQQVGVEAEAGGDEAVSVHEEPQEKEADTLVSQLAELVEELENATEPCPDGNVDSPPVQERVTDEQERTDTPEPPVAAEAPSVSGVDHEQESPAEQPAGGPVDEVVQPATDEMAPEVSVRSWRRRVALAPVAGLAAVLTLMDIPFARVNPSAKNLAGYAAVATLVVATAVWVIGTAVITQ